MSTDPANRRRTTMWSVGLAALAGVCLLLAGGNALLMVAAAILTVTGSVVFANAYRNRL